MIALGLVVIALTALVFIALVRMQRCGLRREDAMVQCYVLGPHDVHFFQTDEDVYKGPYARLVYATQQFSMAMAKFNKAAARSAMNFREYFGNWQNS